MPESTPAPAPREGARIVKIAIIAAVVIEAAAIVPLVLHFLRK